MKNRTSPTTSARGGEPSRLFSAPISVAYWKTALSSLRSTRILTTTALLCALCALIDMFFVPVGGAFLRIYFSFLLAGLLCMISGPVLAIPAGLLVDTLSFLFSGGDPSGYFPGYALSAMCSYFIYALFFYRAKLSLSRLFCARLCVNVFINVILGSVWKHILYGNAYLVYFISGAVKNIALLPAEAFLMLVLYRRLVPVLKKASLVPAETELSVSKRDYIICAAATVLGIAVLILYYLYKN
ncbi:MAG: folate family ECF transporter S component [Clostridia bacterium]|nr:folate family ECF transporter S component [Clostridia bacterium]